MPDNISREQALSEIAETGSAPLPTRGNRKFNFNFDRVTQYPTSFFDGDKMRHEVGYFKADSVRLVRVSIRDQVVKGNRQAFIANFDFIADNEEIGLVDKDGNETPHPLYTSEDYKIWREMLSPVDQIIPGRERLPKPHRISGQQFVYAENIEMLVDFLNELKNHDMTIQRRPPITGGRRTQDMYRAVPRAQTGMDITNTGVLIDGFEISVNPTYEPGFRSFYAGLEDQRTRIERMIELRMSGQSDMFKEMKGSFERNSHYLNGIYDEETNGVLTGRQWPRTADVGMMVIDSKPFSLYRSGIEEVSTDDFDEVVRRNQERSQQDTGADTLPY